MGYVFDGFGLFLIAGLLFLCHKEIRKENAWNKRRAAIVAKARELTREDRQATSRPTAV